MIGVDVILASYPILILNFEISDLNNHWYFYAIVLAFFSAIDPLFKIHFSRHKINETTYVINVFKITSSVFIGMVAFILPLLMSKKNQTVEQSNDIFFIMFSLLCFTKFITLFTHYILKNKVVAKSLALVRQTWPFLIKMMTIYSILLIFYAQMGRILFGGKIHSLSVSEYTKATGLNLRSNYQYLHFNDIFSSLLTLLVLLMQNNWVFVVEQLYFVNNSVFTTIFIVSYNYLSAFIITSLFFGVISRLIMIYFEGEFDTFHGVTKKTDKKSVTSDVTESESQSEYGHK